MPVTLGLSAAIATSVRYFCGPGYDRSLGAITGVVQVTVTLVTLAAPVVPVPFVTSQILFAGCVATLTSNATPVLSDLEKVNAPSLVMKRSSLPLLRRTTFPAR